MKTDHVTEDNLEIVLDWIDAMRIGDPDRFADRLASDIVWWDVSGQPACRGRDEVLEWLHPPVGTECRVAVRAQEAALLDQRSRDPEVSP